MNDKRAWVPLLVFLALIFSLGAATLLQVSRGGTGKASFTAQTPILGGTTTTGPLQSATEPTSDIIWGWDDTDDLTKAITIGSGLTYTHSSHTLSAGADLDSIGDPIGGAHNYRYLRTDGSAQLAENAAPFLASK